MKCATCSMEYGMTHNCAGARPAIVLPAIVAQETAPPTSGFSPIHYIREAFRIATWDENAIRRMSRDPHALFYGIVVWIVANSLPFIIIVVELDSAGRPSRALQVLMGLAVLLPVGAVFTLAQIGVCFALAK
jgi:hypothetical protein